MDLPLCADSLLRCVTVTRPQLLFYSREPCASGNERRKHEIIPIAGASP